MHIVHVIQSDAFAGVEKHVAQLAGAQVAMGHDVTVIGGRGAEVLRVAGTGRVSHRASGDLPSTVRALRHRLVIAPADVVHAHMTAAEVAAAIVLFPSGPPLVTTRHFAQPRGRNVAIRSILKVVATRVSAQIAVSRFVARSVEGDSTVVLPGVPDQPLLAAVERRERVVLVVQRLEPEKATKDALTAFDDSGLATQGWQLHVAGDGSERNELERRAAALNLGESVRFLGHRDDVSHLMSRSAILLAPCPTEGLGLTVLEAMASGLPVVAARSGGHLETAGSVAGAALYDPGALHDAASLLVELAQDPSRREEYGRALQQRQRQHFSLESQAVATQAVYLRVLRDAAGNGGAAQRPAR